jgi:hypothetical protein
MVAGQKVVEALHGSDSATTVRSTHIATSATTLSRPVCYGEVVGKVSGVRTGRASLTVRTRIRCLDEARSVRTLSMGG